MNSYSRYKELLLIIGHTGPPSFREENLWLAFLPDWTDVLLPVEPNARSPVDR